MWYYISNTFLLVLLINVTQNLIRYLKLDSKFYLKLIRATRGYEPQTLETELPLF